jgi:ATP-binding cassette subfamily B protein
MDNACRYADRPVAFLARYVMMRPVAHAVILAAVVAAVGCSVAAQYGVKVLVDILAGGISGSANIAHAWLGFLFLADRRSTSSPATPMRTLRACRR